MLSVLCCGIVCSGTPRRVVILPAEVGREERRAVDDQQIRRVNEAAEKFADAATEAFRTVSEHTTASQQLNAELTQQFFNSVIENLRQQAESNREIGQQLADHTQRQQEATQQLTQESVGVYMNFINSMFAFYQQGARQTQQPPRDVGQPQEQQTPQAESSGEGEMGNIVRESVRRSAGQT